MITLKEAKNYLRVDYDEDDKLIQNLLVTSKQLVMDVGRMSEEEFSVNEDTVRTAMLFALGYLYENRSNPDYHKLTLCLRSILFAQREGVECKAGRIDYILTKSVSRFSRNTTDCISLVRELLDMNIPIYFEKENIDTGSMESELVLSILSSMAQDESRSISENNKWAIKKKFEKGSYKFSYVPYGYMRDDDGNMIINPKEADTIRYIFQSVLNGFGTDKIAKTLDARKIPTRKGGKWSGATVRDILCNEKYYGAAAFQKTYTDENFHRKRNYGEVDSFFDPEHHEPIISKNVFDRVREIIDRRATEKNVVSGDDKYQQRYVFSGKIICGECGDKFRRKIHDSGKEIAWSCRTHIQNIEKCSMKYVRDDMLKAAFVNMMNKLIYARKRLLIPLYENLSIQECDENINRIHALQAELQKMSDKKETLRKLRAQDIKQTGMGTG